MKPGTSSRITRQPPLWCLFNILTLSGKDTVFDRGLFNPLQLRLHLFGVLAEVDALKTDAGEKPPPLVTTDTTDFVYEALSSLTFSHKSKGFY